MRLRMLAILCVLGTSGCTESLLSNPTPSSSPMAKEQQLAQTTQELIAALEKYHEKSGGYPQHQSPLALSTYPENIAYRRLTDADGYVLEEWLGTKQDGSGSPIIGCVYSSQTRVWKCP